MSRVWIRIIGAPLLLAAVGGCLLADWQTGRPYAVGSLLLLISLASFHELCAMGRVKGLKPVEWAGHLAILAPYVAFIAGWQEARLLGGLMPVGPILGLGFLLLLVPVFRFETRTPVDSGFTMLAAVYLLLLSSVLVFHRLAGPGWVWWLIFLVATTKGSDMAAYVFGKLMGQHKMAPRVSPNKTWEGGAAGLAAGSVLGFVVLVRSPIALDGGAARFWTLAIAVTLAGMLGDLVKSAIKRWAGVKDSGSWIPEFGGALDMCDSFVTAAPVAAVLVVYG